jgi:hypothetical protein
MKVPCTLAAAALAVGLILPSLHASAAPLRHRMAHQQMRIHQGVQSGTLTRREARRMERQERRMALKTRRAWRSGGQLTPVERTRLEGRYNRESRRIYRQKHDQQNR